jgi:hypothetical protein
MFALYKKSKGSYIIRIKGFLYKKSKGSYIIRIKGFLYNKKSKGSYIIRNQRIKGSKDQRIKGSKDQRIIALYKKSKCPLILRIRGILYNKKSKDLCII